MVLCWRRTEMHILNVTLAIWMKPIKSSVFFNTNVIFFLQFFCKTFLDSCSLSHHLSPSTSLSHFTGRKSACVRRRERGPGFWWNSHFSPSSLTSLLGIYTQHAANRRSCGAGKWDTGADKWLSLRWKSAGSGCFLFYFSLYRVSVLFNCCLIVSFRLKRTGTRKCYCYLRRQTYPGRYLFNYCCRATS